MPCHANPAHSSRCASLRALFHLLVCGVLCLGNPQAVQAAAQDDPYVCASRQYELLTAYHLFSAAPGDRENKALLEQRRPALDACIKGLGAQLDQAALAKISADYLQFVKDLNYNVASLNKKGFAEGAPLAEMVKNALGVASSLVRSARNNPDPQVVRIKELAVQMAYLNNRYVERSLALGGDSSRDDSSEPAIEDIVKEFAAGLEKARATASKSPELNAKLKPVYTRFSFIRGSLLNYNQNVVPFIVNRHATVISQALMEIATSMPPR